LNISAIIDIHAREIYPAKNENKKEFKKRTL